MLRMACIFAGVLALSACSSLFNKDETIAGLESVEPVRDDLAMPRVSFGTVRDEYEKVLDVVEDQALREAIERRIAGVHMMESEYRQMKGAPQPEAGYFHAPIEAYKEILRRFPNSPDNDEVLYQLAKGYDLEAEPEQALAVLERLIHQYPGSERIAEAYFRMGEIHFAHERYLDAEDAYAQVVAVNDGSVFVSSAQYMLGWSLYKQGLYRKSLQAFAVVLDQVVPKSGELEGLGKTERSLVDDTLYVMSLSLSYLGGASAIADLHMINQHQGYVWLLYDSLGKLYLNKERFEDSAKAYRAYVKRYPSADRAPELHAQMIRAYVQGDFPQQVLPEKENYVRNYGIHSHFWRTKPDAVKAKVRPKLKVYLNELARYYHGTGQRLIKTVSELERGVAHGKVAPAKLQLARTDRDQSFDKAADYYKEFIATFPKDPKVAEMNFMMAEAMFDAKRYPEAIAAYEKTAYVYRDKAHAANAAYASIVAYSKHLERLEQRQRDEATLVKWKTRRVEAQLKFAQVFSQDKRSARVLAHASEELFALKQYTRALAVAQGILNNQAKTDPELQRTALRVMAHSYFALEDYPQAETNYRKVLATMRSSDKGYRNLRERLAASIYKQGEQQVQAGNLVAAVEHFLRVKQAAPETAIRVTAQFDAASYLLQLERWDEAISELKDLQRRYPNSKHSRQIPGKLAYAYAQSEQWLAAAEEYYGIYRNSDDAEEQREALLLAAEYYAKSGDNEKAIIYYRRYAYDYPKPFSDRMEARYQLAVLYEQENEVMKHLYWLRRVIQGNDRGGDKQTERSNYLAAWASAKYGDFHLAEVKRIRLRLPIGKYLPKKQEHMQAGIRRYERAAEYGFPEFAAKATYGMGRLYARFSRDLMDSPRPRGLKSLELMQYEILLEEQAIPFEEMAIEIHQANVERSWNGYYDQWVEKSFEALADLMPARFNKQEVVVSYDAGIH